MKKINKLIRAVIPDEIKKIILEQVNRFNKKHYSDDDYYYIIRFRGLYCYIDRYEDGDISPIFRMTFTGDMNEWDCAIYKWSIENYDPDEWMYPGYEIFDGTIESALLAGIEAYPF